MVWIFYKGNPKWVKIFQNVLEHPVLSVLDTLSSVVAEGNPEGIICTLLPRSVFQSFVSSLFSIIRFEEMMWKLFLLSPPRLSFVWCIILSLLKIESAAKWPKMAFSTPFSGEIQAEIGVESWAKQECIVAENLIFEFSRLFKLCLHFGSTASCADRLC